MFTLVNHHHHHHHLVDARDSEFDADLLPQLLQLLERALDNRIGFWPIKAAAYCILHVENVAVHVDDTPEGAACAPGRGSAAANENIPFVRVDGGTGGGLYCGRRRGFSNGALCRRRCS